MQTDREKLNRIGTLIVESCIAVHKELGPGLLESAYQACLAHELRLRGVKARCEIELPIEYRGMKVEAGYRIDVLVEDCLIIENKSVQEVLPIHEAQLLTYLRLSGCRLGYLVNWNSLLIKDGIRRFAQGL